MTSPVCCQICGRGADPGVDGDPPLTWVMDRDEGRISWTCPGCAARHVRSMEAQLDPKWW
jgi:hypothetical protein